MQKGLTTSFCSKTERQYPPSSARDNRVYSLTTGQYTPTSRAGLPESPTPEGTREDRSIQRPDAIIRCDAIARVFAEEEDSDGVLKSGHPPWILMLGEVLQVCATLHACY